MTLRSVATVIGLTASVVACNGGSREGRLKGRVIVADQQPSIECMVTINSETEPFYTPRVIPTKANEEFVFSYSSAIDGVFVNVECPGYKPKKLGGLTLPQGREIDVGDLKPTREPVS
jgi:hypothetical protein